jgi:secretion/DNA translocation related TadE-like protein
MIALVRRRRQPETGSVTVLAGGILLLSGALVLASLDLMQAVRGRARAQVAADAAALAAAQEIALPSGRSPAEVAAEYAARNGATLLYCRCDPVTSEAVVEVEAPVTLVFVGPDRTVLASARAVIEGAGERDPGRPGTMARDAGPATQRQRAP